MDVPVGSGAGVGEAGGSDSPGSSVGVREGESELAGVSDVPGSSVGVTGAGSHPAGTQGVKLGEGEERGVVEGDGDSSAFSGIPVQPCNIHINDSELQMRRMGTPSFD